MLALASTPATASVQMQHIRNATTKIEYAGKTFLVDPFLAKKGIHLGFEGTFRSHLRNPTVELPMSVEDVLKGVDAVIMTHTHLDHWDGDKHQQLPKGAPLFVQNDADAKTIRAHGFTDVRVLGENTEFEGVRLTKTGGQHGTDEMYANRQLAEGLGAAMGVVFQAPNSPTVYLAGNTIWRNEVEQSLAKFKPDVILLNAGEARMLGFVGSIIMVRTCLALKLLPVDLVPHSRENPGAVQSKPGFFSTHPRRYTRRWLCGCARC